MKKAMKLTRDGSGDSLLDNGPRSEYVKKYPEYPVQKTKSFKPSNDVVKSGDPIDSLTINKRDFPEHQIQRRAPYKPDTTRPDLGAFDGKASYREEYPEWDLPKKQPRQRQQWNPPEQAFNGHSTNMDDFKEHEISPRTNYKPDNAPVQSEAPFKASSDYADTFKQHPLPKKTPREREQWVKPAVPFDATTTKQQDFRGEYAPKQKSMRPDMNPVMSDAPLQGDTTMSSTYKAHELPKRQRHEPEKYSKPEGVMDLNTTNGTQFVEHPLQRQAIQKPDSSHILRGKGAMEKDTNYHNDFPVHDLKRTLPYKPTNEYQRPSVPMNTVSEYQSDFDGRQAGPRQSFKPKNAPLQSDVPFEDRTSYRDKFTKYDLPPKQHKNVEIYEGPKVPMDTSTTVRESYKGLVQPRREMFRPDKNPVQSDAPFDDSTTMNKDYKAHEVKKRETIKQKEYQKPEGHIDLVTSNAVNYVPHQLQRHKIEKPSSSHLLKGSGEMDSQTNYRGDFVERPIERRKNMKPDHGYQRPSEPMCNETTHNAAYLKFQGKPRESFKPKSTALMSDVPIDDRTGYKDSFVPHQIPPQRKREQRPYNPPTERFDATTTVGDSYKGYTQPVRTSFRPDRNAVMSDAAFEGHTTMNADFKAHQMPERYTHKPETYQKPEGYMDLTTTTAVNYREHDPQRVTVHRPVSSGLLKGFGEMSKDTNYQGNFKQPPPVKRQLVKPKHEYQPPSNPMDTTTTSKISYLDHGVSPRTSFKPKQEYSKPEIPFDDTTDYKLKFPRHEVTQRMTKEQEVYQPPTEKIDTRTTANESYIGTYQPKRESFRPDRNYVQSDQPFETRTTAATSFKEWPVAQRQRHKQAEYVKPDGYMDLTTMNRETYREVTGQRPQIVRKSSSHLLSKDAKFDSTTSYGAEYVEKSLGERKLMKPDNTYVPPSIPFEARTEYRSTHVGHVGRKERSFKPDPHSDALLQRDPNNPFRIQRGDWRQVMAQEAAVQA